MTTPPQQPDWQPSSPAPTSPAPNAAPVSGPGSGWGAPQQPSQTQAGQPQLGYPQPGYPQAGQPQAQQPHVQPGQQYGQQYGQPPAGYPVSAGYPPTQPGYQHTQPGGYPAPPPVTKRIPQDQPFIVRPSVRKRGLLFGGLLLFILVLLACPLGLALSGGGSTGDGSQVFGVLGVLGCVLAVIGLPLGLQLWLLTSGGPVMAVGPAGMWIKTRPTRGQAIWLPWEGIERISRRRWSLEKMVVVKARDPRADNNLGAFTAVDSSLQKLFYGSGFTATLNFADRPEAEIMAAITHFSAGRTHIV